MLKIYKKIGNIGIIGFGREGKSLANFLYKTLGCKNITICDQEPAINTRQYPKYQFRLGKNYLKNIKDFNIIYLSPGVLPHIKEIKNAAKNGVKISSATELFFNLCPVKIIGITGTKGKGTVATILYNMLKTGRKKVFLVGNIGKPAIEILPKLITVDKNTFCINPRLNPARESISWVVMELSSFQLQNLKKSPHIAIVLKITADHLDYHKNLKKYFEAKTNILRWQKPGDIAIIHKDNKKINILKKIGGSQKIIFNGDSIISPASNNRSIYEMMKNIDFSKIKIPGKHNLENMIAASLAAKILKISNRNIQKVVNDFNGQPHRLEFVKNINGVKYYNDSAATNPDATIAAIKSFQAPIILITGGQSKGVNFENLGKTITKSSVKKIILFGENKREIALNLRDCALWRRQFKNIYPDIVFVFNIKQAVKMAKKQAEKGDIVLFSPASASFDQFKNYEERGLAFKRNL